MINDINRFPIVATLSSFKICLCHEKGRKRSWLNFVSIDVKKPFALPLLNKVLFIPKLYTSWIFLLDRLCPLP
jgi:hypothetical protein